MAAAACVAVVVECVAAVVVAAVAANASSAGTDGPRAAPELSRSLSYFFAKPSVGVQLESMMLFENLLSLGAITLTWGS